MKFAIFEDSLNTQQANSYLFTNPLHEIKIYKPEDFVNGLATIETLSKQGLFLAGYIAYNAAGTVYQQLPSRDDYHHPLLHFVAYQNHQQFKSGYLKNMIAKSDLATLLRDNQEQPAALFNYLELAYDYSEYQRRFTKVQEQLKLGNSYQINLTLPLHLTANSNDLFWLYYTLSRSHPVGYASYLPFLPQTIISISPELFFKKVNEKIYVKPMKGTMPRGTNSQEDQHFYDYLKNDAKNQAENLIIVDLLRNDLTKFCVPRSVNVDELFAVESFKSVFQMTSSISGAVDQMLPFAEIIHGLFPCGSISGAPKLKTLELIDQVENYSRGVYTGAVGYILPNNDMQFSVAIRTLSAVGGDLTKLSLGVGGGITVQSTAYEEWQEIYSKLRFVRNFYLADFDLIESFLVTGGIIHNLNQHLLRLQSSAEKLGFAYLHAVIYEKLLNYSQEYCESQHNYKLRLQLMQNGECLITHEEISTSQEMLTVVIAPLPLDTTHGLFKHKTTSKRTRELYDSIINKHKPSHIDELLFINKDGIITESRYHNIIINYRERLITTPVSYGLLPGIYRDNLLQSGQLIEEPIKRDMLEEAAAIYLCNDVRGLIHCQLVLLEMEHN